MIAVPIEVLPTKRIWPLHLCSQCPSRLVKLAIAIAFVEADFTLKLGKGQIVVSVPVEIGHAHPMTQISAKMVGVKQPLGIAIHEGLDTTRRSSAQALIGEQTGEADVGRELKCHGGGDKGNETIEALKVFYKIVNFIDKHNGFERK